MTERLRDLADKFGTDKGPYCPVYESYFAASREKPIRLFEIGIGGYADPSAGGASLKMWKSYFPKGQIFGFDLYDKSAHREERIATFQGDQTNAALLNYIVDQIGPVDIIVDDGSHVSAHLIASFEILFPRLSPGGLYVVEDIGTSYWAEYGGSADLNDPSTSLNYFRRGVHDINVVYHRGGLKPRPSFEGVEWLHFYQNLIVIKKAGSESQIA